MVGVIGVHTLLDHERGVLDALRGAGDGHDAVVGCLWGGNGGGLIDSGGRVVVLVVMAMVKMVMVVRGRDETRERVVPAVTRRQW